MNWRTDQVYPIESPDSSDGVFILEPPLLPAGDDRTDSSYESAPGPGRSTFPGTPFMLDFLTPR
ncbi:MAG: hypothetical protein AAGI88_18335 [Pseudomonadota bacterium]